MRLGTSAGRFFTKELLEVGESGTGKSRGAVVKVPNKSGQTTTLRRPLQLLYPLELKCKDQYEQQGESAESNNQTAELTVEPEDQAINPARHPDEEKIQETRPSDEQLQMHEA